MSTLEPLSEISKVKEELAELELMPRFTIEVSIEEEDPLPDEIEAIESRGELIDVSVIKRELVGKM